MTLYSTKSATVSAARRAMERLAALPDQLRQARAEHDRRMEELNGPTAREVWSEAYRTRQLDQAQARYVDTVTALRAQRDQMAADLTQLAVEVDQFPPDGDALLIETRMGKAWERLRPQLEAGRHWSSVVADATAEGDVDTLRALRVELPAWAAGREVYDSAPSIAAGIETSAVEFRERVRAEVDPSLARIASGPEAEVAEIRVRLAATLGLVDALLTSITQEAVRCVELRARRCPHDQGRPAGAGSGRAGPG